MKELVESVRQHGLLQPLVCYRDGENGEDLWLVAGTRRLFAAKEAGLKTVPVTVRAGLTQDEILDIQLEENLQREALDPIDRDVVMLREFDALSYGEIAEALAIPLNTVRSRLFRARMALKENLQ